MVCEVKSGQIQIIEKVVSFVAGELTMIQPARADIVEGGKFTIVVRATDGGKPPLHSDVKVSSNCLFPFSDICTQV
jgi:hypothetical protein